MGSESMNSGDAVIGYVSAYGESVVADYTLSSLSFSGVNVDAVQDVNATSVVENGAYTEVVWTRPLSTGDPFDKDIVVADGFAVPTMWALGFSPGPLGRHSDRGHTEIYLTALCPDACSSVGQCGADNTCTCADGYSGDSCAECAGAFTRADDGTCVFDTSIVGQAVQYNSLKHEVNVLNGMSVAWTLEGDYIYLGLQCKTTGWVAFGMGTKMMDASVIIVSVVGTEVDAKIYDIKSREVDGLVASGKQTAQLVDGFEETLTTTVTFRLPAESFAATRANWNEDRDVDVVYAYGLSDTLSQHAGNSRGTGTINFVTGESSTSASWRSPHGGIMFAAWGILFPFAIYTALFLRHKEPFWFQAHRALNGSGVVLLITGFILSVANVVDHFETAHSILGMGTFLVTIVNPVMGFYRPRLSSKSRLAFNQAHSIVGILAFALSIASFFTGISQLEADNERDLYFMLAGWYVFLLFVFVGSFALLFKKSRAAANAAFLHAQKFNTVAVAPAAIEA